MTNSRITEDILEEILLIILREQFKRDGLPPNHLPSWKYITANTRFSAEGLNNKTQELYGQTLHEFLRENGLGVRNSGKWPTDHEETIQSLVYFTNSVRDRKKWCENTIDSVESAINKVYEVIREAGLDVELLDLGVYDSRDERRKNIQLTITIIEHMKSELSDGTMENYSYYFEKYYDIVGNNHRIDFNPVTNAQREFEWHRSASDPQSIDEKQLKKLWNTLDALEECPVQGYDLDEWRRWMKILIVFLIAVGPRSSEVEQLDVRTQLHFGEDPYVEFGERKNLRQNEGPDKVPIMMGEKLLELYVDYVEAIDGNGKLIPSPQSESGSRTPATLNSWLKRLCKIANVRLNDGSLPTIQNFRQFWKEKYKKAVHLNREEIKFGSDEAGTKDPKVDEQSYLREVTNRKHIRDLARDYFRDVLDLAETYAALEAELKAVSETSGQSQLDDYNTRG